MEPHRVLITGGAGFLGRHLAAALADNGWSVTVLDDLSCLNSTFDCPQLQHSAIECIQGTIADAPLIQELVAAHPVVVHFASVVGVEETISKPIETIRNLAGTLNLVDALTPEHIVLFGSSADVYGMHSILYERAMHEDDLVVFESASVNRWVYPKVKALEEKLVEASPAVSITIRIFNSYGFDMDYPLPKRVVPQFVKQILDGQPLQISGDGRQARSFCFYEDTVSGISLALQHALEQKPPYHQTFNIGHTEAVSVLELAHLMNELAVELGILDSPLPLLAEAELYSQAFTDSWSRAPDISRAHALLGFQPTINLRDGLRKVLTYYSEAKPTVALLQPA